MLDWPFWLVALTWSCLGGGAMFVLILLAWACLYWD